MPNNPPMAPSKTEENEKRSAPQKNGIKLPREEPTNIPSQTRDF